METAPFAHPVKWAEIAKALASIREKLSLYGSYFLRTSAANDRVNRSIKALGFGLVWNEGYLPPHIVFFFFRRTMALGIYSNVAEPGCRIYPQSGYCVTVNQKRRSRFATNVRTYVSRVACAKNANATLKLDNNSHGADRYSARRTLSAANFRFHKQRKLRNQYICLAV